VADTLADYRKANPGCELYGLLEALDPDGWDEHWFVWQGRYIDGKPAWSVLDVHHIFGSREGDAVWNLVRACRPAHEFVQSTWVGMLVCLLVKEEKGELMLESAAANLRKNPVGLVCNALEKGFYSGRCESAARDFCRRHGL
jgi:hypothetical protein